LECWEPSQHLLIDTGKPRKTCVEVASRRTFRILTSSQQTENWVLWVQERNPYIRSFSLNKSQQANPFQVPQTGPLRGRDTLLWGIFTSPLTYLFISKALTKERPPMFPKIGAPMETDAHSRALLTYLFTYLLTYLLTLWCRVLLEKLTGLQLVKKFLAFHGTRRFITALTSVRHLSLSCASPIQSIYPHPTSWRSILILSTHLRLGPSSGLLPSG